MAEFTPSTVPGCRTPHFWLENVLDNSTSLYDAMGMDYALLRFDPSIEVEGLVDAAAKRQMPLVVLDIPPQQVPDVYVHKLLLSRPDQHVAWRGDQLPEDVGALVEQVCGGVVR